MLPPASRRPCFSYLALENFSSFHFFPLPWSWRYTPSTLLPVVDNHNDLVKVSKLFRIKFTLFAVWYHLRNVKNVKNTHGVSTLWIPQMVPNWKTLVNFLMGYVQLSSLSQNISKKPYETNSFRENNYTFAPSIFTNKGLRWRCFFVNFAKLFAEVLLQSGKLLLISFTEFLSTWSNRFV